MGRHSAPDDGSDAADVAPEDAPTIVLTAPARRARHSRGEAESAQATTGPIPRAGGGGEVPAAELLPGMDAADESADLTIAPPAAGSTETPATQTSEAAQPPVVSAPPEAAPTPVAEAGAGTPNETTRERGSASDFSLVRRHGDVRARVIAGVLVPLVVYAVVLAATGATLRVALLWLFAPLVAAGILVGVFLDAGHKRHHADRRPDEQ